MYTGVDSDVARESYSFDLFDMPLDVPLECKKAGIHGLCTPVDSFDLRCESVTSKVNWICVEDIPYCKSGHIC